MTRRNGAARRPNSVRRFRLAVVAWSLAVVATACSAGDALTEYVELLNTAVATAEVRADEFRAEEVLSENSTPQEVEQGLLRLLEEIRIPLQEASEALDPPPPVAGLHTDLFGWHAEFISIETALAERAGEIADTPSGWALFSDSPEVAAYRESLAEGQRLCADLQAQLDATEARGEFKDTPWLPDELKEVVNAAIGCEGFPDDPSSVYRYSPP